ncbi:MAG TPA: hypothetical protein VF416_05105 [Marmoricola sp.]|jgi:hypothetical protein
MSMLKRAARVAVGAILATGILAGVTAPADAAAHEQVKKAPTVSLLDTGWGP